MLIEKREPISGLKKVNITIDPADIKKVGCYYANKILNLNESGIPRKIKLIITDSRKKKI